MRVHMLVIGADSVVERSDYIEMNEMTAETCLNHTLKGDKPTIMDHVFTVRGSAQSIVVEHALDKPWTWLKTIYTAA